MIEKLRKQASEGQDWRSRYVLLALEREPDENRLRELEQMLEERPPLKAPVSPVKVLFDSLESRLGKVSHEEYKKLEASVKSGHDRGHVWDTLRPLLGQTHAPDTQPLPSISQKDLKKRKSHLTLQILKRLAETEGTRPPREVRADREELLRARDARKGSTAMLERLLKRLENAP